MYNYYGMYFTSDYIRNEEEESQGSDFDRSLCQDVFFINILTYKIITLQIVSFLKIFCNPLCVFVLLSVCLSRVYHRP